MAAPRDAAAPRHRGGDEAPVEGAARQPAAPDAQPLRRPRRRRRADRAGTARAGHRGRRLRQRLRHRRPDRPPDLEAPLRQHLRGVGQLARLRAVPGRADGDAHHRAHRDPGQVHGLCDLLGRAAAHARCRHRGGDGSPRAVPAPQRQALRAELLRQRALHHDRAGLRRQSEPVLFVRPGHQEGRQLRSRQRRAVAASRARPSARTAACTPAAATATTFRSSRSSARPSSRPSRTRPPRPWRCRTGSRP